jgi:translation initiation factor 2 alpha subunit (eIF-2alpha)
MKDLKRKQEAASKRLQELGSSSSEAWEEVKAGTEKAFGELQKAYSNAAQKFE